MSCEQYPIEVYWDIFRPHKYTGMPDKEFCWLCKHSLWFHIENAVGEMINHPKK